MDFASYFGCRLRSLMSHPRRSRVATYASPPATGARSSTLRAQLHRCLQLDRITSTTQRRVRVRRCHHSGWRGRGASLLSELLPSLAPRRVHTVLIPTSFIGWLTCCSDIGLLIQAGRCTLSISSRWGLLRAQSETGRRPRVRGGRSRLAVSSIQLIASLSCIPLSCYRSDPCSRSLPTSPFLKAAISISSILTDRGIFRTYLAWISMSETMKRAEAGRDRYGCGVMGRKVRWAG